jgi:hypothetical protein
MVTLQSVDDFVFLIVSVLICSRTFYVNYVKIIFRVRGRDAGTIKRQRGANAHQRAPRSIDTGEDINLQLCVDLRMKANALNQVTFKITPHDFAQKASLEM